jgi:ATP-dependent helicase HrpB
LSWLDPPPAAPLAQARDLLRQLEAIDSAGRVTAHGRVLAKLGLHPRLAHMLVKAREFGAPRLACDLAAILSERDILRASAGARDVDLRLRVSVLRGDVRDLPPGITVDARAMTQAVRSSGHWQRDFVRGRPDSADPHEWTGILLAWAYPDRIGRARGEGGRYLLANGRGARFAEPQALSKAEFIVAAELDGAEREARIFLAAPLQLADLEEHFAAQILDQAEIVWDDREHAIRARRERRLGALLLESNEIRNPDPQALQNAALAGLRQLGIAGLPWTPELRQWQARVILMQKFAVPSPEPWPDLSDAALATSLEEWAPPWISGFARREHFARMDLGAALRSRLTYAQGVIVEREAPTHFTVPSGSHIPIDYLDGEIPTLSVRLQEMFGLNQTPSVAAGRLPLLLKLLSPARRPVQITRDLVSFWNRGYHEVKKDLKGRYPKHYWPEDPHTAQPTRRARPHSPSR